MALPSSFFENDTPKNSSITILDFLEFKSLIEHKKVQLIDVRTRDEFNSMHLKNAQNIDLFSDDFNEEFSKLNKDIAIYLYCRCGARSKQCSNKLAAMGFTEIYDLKGGILNYK